MRPGWPKQSCGPRSTQRAGADTYGYAALIVTGRVERRGSGVSLLAQETAPL